MSELYSYILSPATVAHPSIDEVELLLARCEWFAPALVVRVMDVGAHDTRLDVVAPWRAVSSLRVSQVDVQALLSVTVAERIDRFLSAKELRIVAQDGEPEEDIRTEAQFESDDQVVSEPLAEIYLAQGLRKEALSIYRKLSLLNPEKSVYFAELIGKIEKQ